MKESLRQIETEGKTVHEAVEKALKELKVKRSQATIEILREEEKGLFGMPGAKLAKVRVSLCKEQKNP
jgi:predicted RNA-binding protein Jag